MRIIWAFVALLGAAVLVGCAGAPMPPGDDPSIRGTVTTVTPGAEGTVTILVDAGAGPRFAYDIASVRLTPDTRVLRSTGTNGYEAASAADVALGNLIDVWFTGPVAESYPVQATAGTVLVLE